MNRHTAPAMTAALLACVLAGAPMGCATTSSAPNRLSSTTGTMEDIETLLSEGETELNELVASINALESAPDVEKAYRAFDHNVNDIDRIAERVRARRISMQTRASEYVARWESESTTLSSERAADLSEQRRKEFQDSVDTVTKRLDDLRAQYDPFISKLKDLRVVLSNDLTRRGIELTEPIRDNVGEMAQDLRERSADTKQALQKAREEFARS